MKKASDQKTGNRPYITDPVKKFDYKMMQKRKAKINSAVSKNSSDRYSSDHSRTDKSSKIVINPTKGIVMYN